MNLLIPLPLQVSRRTHASSLRPTDAAMTVATTGLNEKSAAAAGLDYDKTYTYSASHASYYPNASIWWDLLPRTSSQAVPR